MQVNSVKNVSVLFLTAVHISMLRKVMLQRTVGETAAVWRWRVATLPWSCDSNNTATAHKNPYSDIMCRTKQQTYTYNKYMT